MTAGYYKDVQAFRNDFKLMFRNAKTYNQEGSWVYVDAQEMERVFEDKFAEIMIGSGLPGAPPASNSGYGAAPVADDRAPSSSRGGRATSNRRQIISDDEDSYLTPSDEE
jgi:ATP-dependent helicase STH1/SNF2